ncbi:ATP-binding protein [Microbacterium sp. B2969]|uniref:ATP-binding protein n=1 Tax=Microbacterium alkaliflavum TaxID=3248839 RepID=A0ABW7QCA2_9MICO
MAVRPAAIRTPDQRLRVFVSSTLKELEPERRAVRAAIESMQLAPVMFELGARPHPPRELYRSYLAQSDVFVGIYAEDYGWVAPGEDVSGLEDEYALSGRLPHLMYVKDPAPDREERLTELLDRIRADDHSSYKSFAAAGELAELVQGDLATLLAERFDATRIDPPAETKPDGGRPGSDIPAPYSAIVGREDEQRDVLAMLAQPGVRLVSLVGPGGIGKSRLAIEIAESIAAEGRDVAFALLEAVPMPDRVIVAIARALGVRDAAAEGSLEDRVVAALADRDVLLVVDNMEHVLAAADLLVRLLTAAPRLQLLVTSRSPLRVRAEHVYDVGPLRLPPEDAPDAAASAVQLFAQRAAAVRPGFRVTPENAASVVAICRAVDGVPLAIELAAARVRSLSVEQILDRLDSALTLLVGGARDLPERQRALRSTIEWSVQLLEPDARIALGTLSVFTGSFSLDSAERVLSEAGTVDPISALEALVDASLLATTDRRGVAMFRMLSLVRAYAGELLPPDRAAAAVDAWLKSYRELAVHAQPRLRGPDQLMWLDRLEGEIENLARATRVMFERRELDLAASYLWSLYLFLWIGGYLGVVRTWAEELLGIAERDGVPIDADTRAIAEYYINAVRFWQEPGFDVTTGLTASRELFREAGDRHGAAVAGISLGLALLSRKDPDVPAAVAELESSRAEFAEIDDAWGQAMVLNVLGRVDMGRGDMAKARQRFEQSLERATSQGERLGIVIAMNSRGWTRLLTGDVAGAHDDFAHSLDLSLALHHDEGIAYGLEAFAGLRAVEGDAVAAGRLLGAAQRLRRRKGLLNPGSFEFYMIPIGALRAADQGEVLDAATRAGLDLTVAEVLDDVRR